MDVIFDLGIQIVLWFQGLGTWLATPMKLLSLFGNEEFFLLLAPLLYWCIDSQIGMRVGLLLMLSACTNTYFKILFHQPRPYWIDSAVKAYGAETSFGIPSGHSQNPMAVWGGMAYSFQKKWFWILAGLLIFLIGISRIFLGVHFPGDVLVGWLFGAILLWIFLKLEPGISAWIQKKNPASQVVFALAASLALILLGVLARLSLGDWRLPAEWAANASAATPDAEPINPLDLTSLVSNSAAFFGLCLGGIFIKLQGGFNARGKFWQLGLRYIIGVMGVLILWAGLRAIFPGGDDWLSLILRYVRYGFVGFWVTGAAPWVFYRLGLVNQTS